MTKLKIDSLKKHSEKVIKYEKPVASQSTTYAP